MARQSLLRQSTDLHLVTTFHSIPSVRFMLVSKYLCSLSIMQHGTPNSCLRVRILRLRSIKLSFVLPPLTLCYSITYSLSQWLQPWAIVHFSWLVFNRSGTCVCCTSATSTRTSTQCVTFVHYALYCARVLSDRQELRYWFLFLSVVGGFLMRHSVSKMASF